MTGKLTKRLQALGSLAVVAMLAACGTGSTTGGGTTSPMKMKRR